MQNNIFILGAARSGTKLLRDCLGAANDVSKIPYDIGYVWKYGNEEISHDELLPHHLTQSSKEFIRKTIVEMATRQAKNRPFNTIIEKSVPNVLRPAFVDAVYPNAKYIHLVRDGRDVIESSIRNWQSPADRGYMLDKLRYLPVQNIGYAVKYAYSKARKTIAGKQFLWGPRYAGMADDAKNMKLTEVCTKQWNICVNACLDQLEEIPQDRILQIHYEDFVEDVSLAREVCKFSKIDDVQSVENYFHSNVRQAESLKRYLQLPMADQNIVMDISRSTLERLNYKYVEP